MGAGRMLSAWLGGPPPESIFRAASPPPIGGWKAPLLPRMPPSKKKKGLASALRIQEQAMRASKLRGTTRRTIGKHSRAEVRERARRLLPIALLTDRETAARRGREASRDARLAQQFDRLECV